MKRTNLVLDSDLLDRAVRAFGVKTYSAAVNVALQEALRFRQLQGIPRYFGQGLWEGELSKMREDNPRREVRITRTPARAKRKNG